MKKRDNLEALVEILFVENEPAEQVRIAMQPLLLRCAFCQLTLFRRGIRSSTSYTSSWS
jgi:hypothetical protein